MSANSSDKRGFFLSQDVCSFRFRSRPGPVRVFTRTWITPRGRWLEPLNYQAILTGIAYVLLVRYRTSEYGDRKRLTEDRKFVKVFLHITGDYKRATVLARLPKVGSLLFVDNFPLTIILAHDRTILA